MEIIDRKATPKYTKWVYWLLNYVDESWLININIKSQEKNTYVLLIFWMYKLALLKHEGLNPERYLQIKFHWRKCESRNNAHLNK